MNGLVAATSEMEEVEIPNKIEFFAFSPPCISASIELAAVISEGLTRHLA
jgi:hypothetical protein